MRPHPALLLPFVLIACDRADKVRSYDAPTDASAPAPAPPSTPSTPPAAGGMAAKAKDGEALWAGGIPLEGGRHLIFKTIAAETALAPLAADLEDLVTSAEAGPAWTLPPGWTQTAAPTDFGRIALLRSPDGKVEVSAHAAGGDLAANINRWLGQCGQPEKAPEAALALARPLAGAKSAGAWQLKLAGRAAAPAAAPAPTDPAPTGPAPAAAPAAGDIAFQLPAGWKQVPPANPQRRLQVDAGDGCTVVVSAFPGQIGADGAIGDMLANLNRWRGQVKLPPLEAMPTRPEAVGVKFSGLSGALLPVGLADPSNPERGLLVAFAADLTHTWFVKLDGPAPQVGARLTDFITFLRALKLPVQGVGAPPPLPLLPVPAAPPTGASAPAHG